MEQLKEDKVVSEFDKYQERVKQFAGREEQAVVFLTLGLLGSVGALAGRAKSISRGDYENRGALIFERVADAAIQDCRHIAMYTASLVTLYEMSFSDLMDDKTFEGFTYPFLRSDTTIPHVVLNLGESVGGLCYNALGGKEHRFKEDIEETAPAILGYIQRITMLLERPFSSVFEI